MRKITYFLFILFLAIILSACSDDKGSTNGSAELDIKDPENFDFETEGLPEYNKEIAELEDRTLDVWLASDFADQPSIKDAVAQFESVYPNVDVNVVGYPWEDIFDQTRKAVGGGNPPDLVHGTGMIEGAEGVAEPLDDLWNKWGKEDEFLKGAIDLASYEGTKYGVPIEINTTFYFYDKEKFEEENVEVPESFEDLSNISNELTTDNQYGFVTVANSWAIYGFIVSQGGNIVEIHEDGSTSPSLNNDQVVKIIEEYTNMAKEDRSSPIPPPQKRQVDNPIAMFGSGRAASFVSGPWDLSLLKEQFPEKYENLGTAMIPGNGEGSVAGGGSLYVPTGSDDKEASFELMKWFVSDKYAMRMAEEMGRTPVKADLYDSDLFNDPLLQPFIETLDNAKAFPIVNQEVVDIFNSAIRDIFDGDDAETRLNQAQKEAKDAIKRAEG
ncbi:Cyclodextrin-binding protein precursor [Paraliobacillus sp. PM-2]|uniref:sugar ABC transporter substrate-binding protein n=1 Tax=Paraliobacillus sp. PM-2 TaxID=1462524 RepID=UPI00061C53A0|nr:sugar ABC transporter substrate-binding protein [Paraliobacillus sp. PM-2]CQR46457.1 Cyclodextrin-binding protein precursor [Paraliobacillus sp. PM-2]